MRSAARESPSWSWPEKTRRLLRLRHWPRSCTERPRRCRCLSRPRPREFSPIAHTFCKRPKARLRRTASLYRANDEADREQTTAPSCAGARDRLCRRLRAAPLPPAQSRCSAREKLHSCLIEPYARATLNLREGLNQAARMKRTSTTNEHEFCRAFVSD